MRVKYKGPIVYNSLEVQGIKPNSIVDLRPTLGQHLIKKFPKWFFPLNETSESVKKNEEKVTLDKKVNKKVNKKDSKEVAKK